MSVKREKSAPERAPQYSVVRSWPGVTRGQVLTLSRDRAAQLERGGYVTRVVEPAKG